MCDRIVKRPIARSRTTRAAHIANATSLIWLLGVGVALAEPCHITGPRYNLVGDTIQWSMVIQSGHSCVRGLRFANVTIESVEVVSKPQSGQLALLGWGFTYSPGADLAEKDFFALTVLGKINKKPGRSTIQVTVSVVGPGRVPPAVPARGPRARLPVPPSAPQPGATEREAPSPAGGTFPHCPIWDWSKGAPPPMRPPFDRSKLYCPPPPFKPPSPPVGCTCPEE